MRKYRSFVYIVLIIVLCLTIIQVNADVDKGVSKTVYTRLTAYMDSMALQQQKPMRL